MNVAKASHLIGVSDDSIRRWTSEYADFLSPTASPGRGKTRVLAPHDLAVLAYIATLRDSGLGHEETRGRLAEMQGNDWDDLPAVPPEWFDDGETMTVMQAAGRAHELATIAALQTELTHVRSELARAENRVGELQAQLSEMETRQAASEDEKHQVEQAKHAVELDLERARADVSRLEGVLSSYSFGREKPVNVGLIVAVALAAGALLVIVAFVVARLVM